MLMYFMNFIDIILFKVREEEGQGMVEYALLVGLIAVVVIGVLVLLGPAIAAKFQSIIDAL
ncbi:Flp family type IVb pilin [Clostridium algoriphilum]|uniref:Flp family type IVb pilin n=1 Tax=Clostridium algoriphilum TaxID=198347 RepID=UPI00299CF0C1|nr:Flp family type IVb pilin [Clostridium algoriphilum]